MSETRKVKVRLFIKRGTVDKLVRKASKGGGFAQAEVLVTTNFELVVPDQEEQKYWVELCEKKETVGIQILENGKRVYMDGKSIDKDEAHEIIIRLTQTWGTDFEKQHLRDLAIMS